MQRERLGRHCRLVSVDATASSGGRFGPALLRRVGEGVVVLIASDVLVTGSLCAVLEEAEQGRIAAFVYGSGVRRVAGWQERFGLASAPRAQPYVNAGFVCFSAGCWPLLLERWRQACERGLRASVVGADGDSPALVAQDGLNAVLMSEVAADALAAHDYVLAPLSSELGAVRVRDVDRVRCVHR